jgi:hypothetical protein
MDGRFGGKWRRRRGGRKEWKGEGDSIKRRGRERVCGNGENKYGKKASWKQKGMKREFTDRKDLNVL